jgi:hypothetical protein
MENQISPLHFVTLKTLRTCTGSFYVTNVNSRETAKGGRKLLTGANSRRTLFALSRKAMTQKGGKKRLR